MINQNRTYLDANFLVAFFADKHTDKDSSRKLLFNLLKSNSVLFISPLALDETWYKIWEIPRREKKLKKNKWPSIKTFYPKIRIILDELKKLPEAFKLIQFENSLEVGINNAAENIGMHELEPRDAFRLAYMQDLHIETIITKDKKDFDKIPGIQALSY
ncbi:MAG: type II toxin-antitoxin system VapC family toxin [Candidatus Shapirobacteria bacterium]